MQFLTMPKATVYGGIGFLSTKSKDLNWFQLHKHTYIDI